MSSRLFALLVWGLAAASLAFWAMRLSATPVLAPAGTRLAINGPVVGADLGRMLGAAPVATSVAAAPSPTAGRFRLTGVVATTTRRSQGSKNAPGVALLSIDGGPVQAYRVGDLLDTDLSLWSVALRSVTVGNRSGVGTAAFVLELPPPVAPAIGTLAQAGNSPSGVAPAAPSYVPPPAIQAPSPALAPSPIQPPVGKLPGQPAFGAAPAAMMGQPAAVSDAAPSFQVQGLPPGAIPAPGALPPGQGLSGPRPNLRQ